MLEDIDPKERRHYRTLLIDKLTEVYSKFSTPSAFFDTRSREIVSRLLPDSELYGSGLTEILTSDTLAAQERTKVVVVTVLDD